MYKVIKYFTDLQDNHHPYDENDEFPRKGLKVSQERIAELAGSENKQGQPLIQLVEEKAEGEKKPAAKKATKKTAGK